MTTREQTFKNLFSAQYDKLCRYAYSFLQDDHAAEDVVQDTFIKIWESRQEIIESPAISFYLVTAVRNNCISTIRKRKTAKMQFSEEIPEPDPEPFFTRSELHQQASERQQQVTRALDQLPPKCKEVFLLAKLHDLSYKQIADVLGISIKTVENQMGKALKVLREAMWLTVWLVLSGYFLMSSANFIGFCRDKSVLP